MSLEIILHLATKIKQLVRDFMAKQLNLNPPASFNLNEPTHGWYTMAGSVSSPAENEIYSTMEPDDADDYEAVKKKVADHFAPLKNLDYEVYAFSQMRQMDGEQHDEFVVRLRVAAIRCEFGAVNDAEFKRQIIRGCSSSNCDSTSSRHPRLR